MVGICTHKGVVVKVMVVVVVEMYKHKEEVGICKYKVEEVMKLVVVETCRHKDGYNA